MIRFFVYLLLLGSMIYLLWLWGRRREAASDTGAEGQPAVKSRNRFRSKKNPWEVWVQVYETASLEEARTFQARLQEEEIDCIIYEQGKKDIHGNTLKGIGIAVPKTQVPHAQSIISRMPV
jgi:hypothetical protein